MLQWLAINYATILLSLLIVAIIVIPYILRYFKRKKYPECPSACIGCSHMKKCASLKK